MSVDFNVQTETRKDVGKGASRRLRHAGKVPGVVYGGGKDAVPLTMEHDHIMHHLTHEAFYSHVLSVSVDGKAEKAVLKDVQRHPSKPKILHVDFLRVSDKEKISMHVPLHFINEETAKKLAEDEMSESSTSTFIDQMKSIISDAEQETEQQIRDFKEQLMDEQSTLQTSKELKEPIVPLPTPPIVEETTPIVFFIFYPFMQFLLIISMHTSIKQTYMLFYPKYFFK